MTMTHTNSTLPFGAITTHRIVSFANEMFDRYRTWTETRRTVATLRSLTAEQLEDIGLTPGDIEDFANGRPIR